MPIRQGGRGAYDVGMGHRRSLAVAATSTALLSVLAGCALSGASSSDGSADGDVPVSERPDLSTALLTLEDLADVTADYGDFEETQLPRSSSDSMIDGDPQCEAYLDGDYGAESVDEARTAFSTEYEADAGDDGAELYVLSTVRAFTDADDATQELDGLRDVFAACDAYMLESDGAEVTVQVLDFADVDEAFDVGDEGVTLAMSQDVGSNLAGEYAYVFTRIDDAVVAVGAYNAGLVMPISRDLMLHLTEVGAERVRDYVDAG